jgi:protein gp37
MADQTEIEWTDATWNPITGCTLVDHGCDNCYAARLAATRMQHHPSRAGLTRLNAAGVAKWTGEVRFNEQWLDQPLRWTKPRRIFVCAHGDLFHEDVPDDWIDRVFAVMALCPQHTFQVLTKRPERARVYLGHHDCSKPGDSITQAAFSLSAFRRGLNGCGGAAYWPFSNVHLGTSISDQASADKRIPDLLACPAAVRFLSIEPMLGPVDLSRWSGIAGDGGTMGFGLDWVICGGESGPGARVWPGFADAARSLRDQCREAGVAFFMKQMAGARKSAMPPIPDDLMVREFPNA